jgi:tungstate transport system substrate-binding protein
MSPKRKPLPLLVVLMLVVGWTSLCVGCRRENGTSRLRLTTTTSTANSGLLEHLLPPFEEATGIEVVVIAVGTGQALALGERGDADLVLVHAREREDAFVAAGYGIDRRDVMWNDFVIVGPKDDPASIRGETDPTIALKRLQEAKALFVSRGDDSGTHIREQSLWKDADIDPAGDWYWKAGQGMGRCLVMANEKKGYILTDRGTYLAFRSRIDLEILVEGHATLRNPYGAIRVNPDKHPRVKSSEALELLDYLTSPVGQERISTFRVAGEVLFHPVSTY